jgi:hypothetical protein
MFSQINNLPNPQGADSVPVVRNTRELSELILGDATAVFEKLQLTPSEAALIRSGLVRHGMSPASLKPLIIAEYTGVPLTEAFLASNSTLAAHRDIRALAQLQHRLSRYRREIAPDKLDNRFVPIRPFPGVIRELHSSYLPGDVENDHSSRSLILQLPERDWQQVIRNSRDAPYDAPRAFATIRVKELKDFKLEVLEFRSAHYNALTCPTLRERYADWPHVMMRALIDYAAHLRVAQHELSKEEIAVGERRPSVQIILPSPSQIRKIYCEIKDAGSSWGTVPSPEPQAVDEAKWIVPSVSKAESELLFRKIPLSYGFVRSSFDLELSETTHETFRRALSLEVPFIRGKQDQDPLFKPLAFSPRLKVWFDLFREYFETTTFQAVQDQACPLAHPVLPRVDGALQSVHSALTKGAEICPSLTYPEDYMPCAVPSAIEALKEMKERCPGYNLFRRVLPEGFVPMSRGLGYGADDQWWKLPSGDGEQIRAQFIHLKDQNRHPSLRLISYDDAGNPAILGSYSFKGAGVATTEGVSVKKGANFRSPIYFRNPDVVMKDGVKKAQHQFAGHQLWGGQGKSASINEFGTAVRLALFCNEVDPRIGDAVVVPIACERILSIPVWDENGRTDWRDARQFLSDFLPQYSPSGKLFETVTFSRSDVRLSQLVSRLMYTHTTDFRSITALEQDLFGALDVLYRTHGEQFTTGGVQLLPGRTLGLPEIGRFLTLLCEHNHAAATRIYEGFECRALGALAAVHGADGTLGGIKRKAQGIIFGGPQSIRNIDLYGTMHDYETPMLLPWESATLAEGVRNLDVFSSLKFLQAADALLLKESLFWLKRSLFGFRSDTEIEIRRVAMDAKQDITVLFDGSFEGKALEKGVTDLNAGEGPETIIGDQRQIEIYKHYGELGRTVAERVLSNQMDRALRHR